MALCCCVSGSDRFPWPQQVAMPSDSFEDGSIISWRRTSPAKRAKRKAQPRTKKNTGVELMLLAGEKEEKGSQSLSTQ
ncbi:hypothetical protein OUZ56_026772 [Daphnia magna]|uniref:Uncharacterized protein n=1 Tax=Daphnia magna TaxID=35525 RepID=A0ABQ9ZMS8_9CRUS|nr:hypothetical protein OUZ56_026772 [Daphnia magna]